MKQERRGFQGEEGEVWREGFCWETFRKKPVSLITACFRNPGKDSAASLLPHRFVTVRRGSPAAKSGQIRPGDHLEALEGRSVVTLPHRELAQILRRAGNSLKLTIVPRPSTYSSSVSETTEYDPAHRSKKGQRSRPKRDSRYFSVDLDRGSSGFGFSLRGGSEYNMGLYVLGLMEGGAGLQEHEDAGERSAGGD
ncbi:hypothetical protein CgunFtcFv8_001171 [Champsocephalus gunnari]|uniref:PDZ domain-containing protein n=1 Tax=Champsocephalus gunnari TaxID=52237 RepID=A0AAN8DK29_CHAGU|nr:hypothetical protein CgunFtcFv8_001171 [Champsocephalus gunnari]